LENISIIKMTAATLEAKFEPKYRAVPLSEKPLKYSPMELDSYDRERHIPVEDARTLIENQNDPQLQTQRLTEAMASGDLRTYEFDGKQYLDRIDIGRVYHQPKERTGLNVERYFTHEGDNPFDSVAYSPRHLEIKDLKTKKVVFEMDGAEIPDWMNETEAAIVASKYFFRPKKDKWKDKLKQAIGSDHEYSLKQLNKRVADFFTEEGSKLGYFKTETDRENFRNELYFLQINGFGAFNSPTQFNAGLFNSYGISGNKGLNYYKDPETGEVKRVMNGEYVHPQLHACFIKGPNDDLESIAQNLVDEVAIFSSGSGIGHDIGKLRGEGEYLSGGGKSSGSMSFLRVTDRGAGAIKSGGKTRRAARMATMRYQHPDIMSFIRDKIQEDRKALILMQNGFSAGMDGEAYSTVALQNTNLSVRLDNQFFEVLKAGGEVQTYNIKDGKPGKKISAERMLQEIAFGSWRIGDPAVQYEDKIQEMHTAKNSGRINSSNPCSEYMFLDDTSCSLYSMRLTAFMKEDGTFNAIDFKRALRVFTIAQNIANKSASYPVREVALVSPEYATIGGGYADLGSLLMRSGVPYDSENGRATAAAITALLTGTIYETSAEIAGAMGAFTHFEFNRKPMMEVMEKHRQNLEGISWGEIKDDGLKGAVYQSWEKAIELGEKFGYSNAQASVIAPTGTISFLMGCSTTSGEPAMALSITKNLAGGGNITIANKDVEIALKNLGYRPDQIEDISKYIGREVAPNTPRSTIINAPHVRPEHYSVFNTAFGNYKGQGSIDFEGHVRMLGATQPFISGAISKTNNQPERATVKNIYDGYLLGQELGLKAISIFRNNSKPIAAVDFGGKSYVKLKRGEKEDLPGRRPAFETEVVIGGKSFHVMASDYPNGTPGQITFLSYKSGSTLGAHFSSAGVSASKSLKRGVHLEDITEGWLGQEFKPNGLVHGHPYIKTASSPLDFAAKALRLEYLGDLDMVEPDLRKEVNVNDLWGAKNGAFRTYQRMKIDEWKFEDVMKDAETGGFVAGAEFNGNGNGNHKNDRGVTCERCGNIMLPTGPNCFKCGNCGDSVGGCGA